MQSEAEIIVLQNRSKDKSSHSAKVGRNVLRSRRSMLHNANGQEMREECAIYSEDCWYDWYD